MFSWQLCGVMWLHFIFMRNKTWKADQDEAPCTLKCRLCRQGPRWALLTCEEQVDFLGFSSARGRQKGLFLLSLLLTMYLVPVQLSSQTLSPLCQVCDQSHRCATQSHRCATHSGDAGPCARSHWEEGLPASSGFVTNLWQSQQSHFVIQLRL